MTKTKELIERVKNFEIFVKKWCNNGDEHSINEEDEYKKITEMKSYCLEEIKQSLLRCTELLEKLK